MKAYSSLDLIHQSAIIFNGIYILVSITLTRLSSRETKTRNSSGIYKRDSFNLVLTVEAVTVPVPKPWHVMYI